MSAIPDKRIAAIRDKIYSERGLLSESNGQISADQKTLLKPASSWLRDAEGWLASEVLRQPPRSEREWARWLD